jgi:hypothetical protein
VTLKAVYRFFRSTSLAVALLLIIAVFSALSTFVPQGRQREYYIGRYPRFTAQLILISRFHRFFGSYLFLIPAGFFFCNLAVCTADRVAARRRRRLPGRYGPDIIHAGILLVMIGGFVSYTTRREAHVDLREGDSLRITRGIQMVLTSFEKIDYPDGRPRDYVSVVELLRKGKPPETRRIRVNRPLRASFVRVYQESYSYLPLLLLSDEQGGSLSVDRGGTFRMGGTRYRFRGIAPEYEGDVMRNSLTASGRGKDILLRDPADRPFIVLQELDVGGVGAGTRLAAPDDPIDGGTVKGVVMSRLSGFRVVSDRSVILVLCSFLIIGTGLALTFLQKLTDGKK